MTRRAPQVLASALLAALLVTVAGCSGNSKLVPATGKVMHNGSPAVGALVVFHPRGDDSVTAVRPSGVVQEDGAYTLFSGPAPDGKGAPPGEYDVAITKDAPPAAGKDGKGLKMGGEAKDVPDAFGGRYKDPRKSGLKATVNPGPTEIPTFDLK